MQSPVDGIIQNCTGMNTVVFFLFFPFCKNIYKHVEKARKGPEKAGNVQRVRFI